MVSSLATKNKDVVIVIDKPHFTVKLHPNLLEVDLKKGIRKELEDALEKSSALRENLGFLFQTIIPLDLPLKDVDSVEVNKKGQLKIVTPLRKDLVIPLKRSESQRLAEKLNELVPIEKAKAVEESEVGKRASVEAERQRVKAYAAERREHVGEA